MNTDQQTLRNYSSLIRRLTKTCLERPDCLLEGERFCGKRFCIGAKYVSLVRGHLINMLFRRGLKQTITTWHIKMLDEQNQTPGLRATWCAPMLAEAYHTH